MIQITVTMVQIISDPNVPMDNLYPLISNEYTKVMSFFQNCVDQNLVINSTRNFQEESTDFTFYFSPTMEKAQEFEQQFQDLTADFSMRKFWNQYGLETSFSFEEVDFNNYAFTTSELVNQELSELWGSKIFH